jgi:hypothetical protein
MKYKLIKKRLNRAIIIGACACASASSFQVASAAEDITMTGDGIWSSAATYSGDGTLPEASQGQTVDTKGYDLTVINNGTANDGQDSDDFTLGAITNTGMNDSYVNIKNGSDEQLIVNLDSVQGATVVSRASEYYRTRQTITITGDVQSDNDGIRARHTGEYYDSLLGLIVNNNITGGDNGLDVRASYGARQFIDITGDVQGDNDAINATADILNGANYSRQEIEVNGDVTSTDENGITANANSAVQYITVYGGVSGDELGVDIDADYAAIQNLTITEGVSSVNDDGVEASASNTARQTITIGANDGGIAIDADDFGLDASSDSNAQQTIDITGDVISGNGYHALELEADNSSTQITTIEGDVTGADKGGRVQARDDVTQTLTITGNVIGQDDDGFYIYAENRAIQTVTVTGNVTGQSGQGLDLYAEFDSIQTVTVNGDVSGSRQAIYAEAHEGAKQYINVDGTVTGGNNNNAVYLYANNVDTVQEATIVGNVSGDYSIDVVADNSANQTLDITGDITIDEDDALSVSGGSDSTQTIDIVGDIESLTTDGIYSNTGSGYIQSIEVEGNITGADEGIETTSSSSAQQLITVTGNVGGTDYGIKATSVNSSIQAVNVTGDVTGTNKAIYLESSGTSDQRVSVSGDINGDVRFNTNDNAYSLLSLSNGDLDGAITVDNDDTGKLGLSGGSTVSGQVGAAGFALEEISSSAGDGETDTFNSDVYATNVILTDTGTLGFDGDVTGNVDFDAAGTVELANNADLTGNVTTATNNTGALNTAGGSTISGTVGAENFALNQITSSAAVGETDTFSSDVYASNINLIDTGTLDFDGDVTGNVNFTADGTVALADDMTITGNVTTDMTNQGTLNLNGTDTITGTIGEDGLALKEINSFAADGEFVYLNDDVYATTVNLKDEGTIIFNNSILQGNIATDSDEQGGIQINVGSSVVMDGSIGTNTNKLNDIYIRDADGGLGNATFEDDIYTSTFRMFGITTEINLNGNLTGNIEIERSASLNIILADSKNITGDVYFSGRGGPELTLANNNTIDGSIRDDGGSKRFSAINVNGIGITTFTGTVIANDININSTGTTNFNDDVTGDVSFQVGGVVDVATTKTIDGNVDSDAEGQGSLILGDGAGVSGTVGATNSLANVQLNNTADNYDLNEAWNTQQFELNGAGSVDVGVDLESNILFSEDTSISLANNVDIMGDITTATNDTGTLNTAGDSTISGTVGAENFALNQITSSAAVGETDTFSNDVYATNVNLTNTGTLDFDGNVTGNVNFAADGTVDVATTKTIDGNVDSDAEGQGSLILGDGAGVSGTVGATNSLANVQLNNTADYDFNENWNTEQLELNGLGEVNADTDLTANVLFSVDTTFNLTDGADLTGSITTANNNEGTLDLAGDSTISGTVGAENFALNQITLSSAAGETDTFSGDVYATNINLTDTGTLDFNGNVTGNVNFAADGIVDVATTKIIDGNVDNDAEGQGSLILGDGAGVSGTVGATRSLANIQLNNTADNYDLNEDWNTQQFELNGAGSVDVGVDLESNILFSEDTTLNMGQDVTLTGAITTGNNNTGTVLLAGDNTITGDIGSTSKRLKDVTSTTLVGQTNTFGGDIYVSANTFHVAGAGLTQLNGNLTGNVLFDDDSNLLLAETKTIDGDINTATAGEGSLTLSGDNLVTGSIGETNQLNTLNINGESQAFSSYIGADTINNTGTTLLFNNAVVTQLLNNTGTLNISSSTSITVSNGLTGNGSYNFEVVGNGYNVDPTIGSIDVGSSAIDISGNTITLTPTGETTFKTGSYDLITTSSTTASTLPSDTDLLETLLYSFTLEQSGNSNEDVALAISKLVDPVEAASGPNKGIALGLQSVIDSADPSLVALNTAAALATTTEVYNDVLDQASNNTASVAIANSSQQATGAASGIVSSRMLSVSELSNTSDNGIATGNRLDNGWQAWGQTFYQRSDQGTFEGLPGYNANTYGITLGADTDKVDILAGDTLLGAAFTYSYTGVSFQDNLGNGGINNYQLMLYGTTYIWEKFFMDGQIGGAYGFNDQTRNISVAGVSANSTFSSMQAIAQTRVGYDYTLFESKRDKVTLAPMATGYYVYYWQQGYQESGAGGASLKVSDANVNTLQLGGALQLGYEHTFDNGDSLIPEIYGGWSYDILDQNVSTSAQFVGGGAVFESPGVAPARGLTTAIAGLTYANAKNNYEVNLQFQYLHRTSLNVYAGVLEGSYNF